MEAQNTVIEKETEAAAESEPAHAKYNPSSLSMWEKCPGYLNREGTNAQAEAGTRIHEALEKDALDLLKNPDEKAVFTACRDYIDSVIESYRPKAPDHDYREIRLSIDLGGELQTFGTCDRLLVYGDIGEMLDYKSGRRFVADAEVNAQAWAYVVGAFQKFPFIKSIRFTFLVPNRDEISSHLFHRKDLKEMTLRLNTIVRRAMKISEQLIRFPVPVAAFRALNPGPELCEYCARQFECPALEAKYLKIADKVAKGKGIPVPRSLKVNPAKPEDISYLLRLAPLLENWAALTKAEALRVSLEEGIEIPGYVQQTRKTPRSITSVAGAWDVAEKMGVTLEDFLLSCGSISIESLEDAAAEHAPRGKKGSTRQELENNLRAADLLKEQGEYRFLREAKK